MMEKKSQVGDNCGARKKGLWLIHHMITDDHPWSTMTIRNHRLVERLRCWFKLTLRLSPVFLSIFSRRMSISWWALSSSSWVFSWAIWYLPAAPWMDQHYMQNKSSLESLSSPVLSQVLLWACPSLQHTCLSPHSCETMLAGSCQTPPEHKTLKFFELLSLKSTWIFSFSDCVFSSFARSL